MSDMPRHVKIDEVDVDKGRVTVVYFNDSKIVDEANIQEIGEELYSLVDRDHRDKILLNFSNVNYLSSAALGKLITLNKKVSGAQGNLKLCNIHPDIMEVFKITRLVKVFDIHATEQQALDRF